MVSKVVLDWSVGRALLIELGADTLRVVAHPELSEGQVIAACEHLGGDTGDAVLSAWRAALGLTPAS